MTDRRDDTLKLTARRKGEFKLKTEAGLYLDIESVKIKGDQKDFVVCVPDDQTDMRLVRFNKYGKNSTKETLVYTGLPLTVVVVDCESDGVHAMVFKVESDENKSDVVARAKKFFGSTLHSVVFPDKGAGL